MNYYNPGRGLAVNFRKKCGEMWWKKNNFHRVFRTSFCGECGESRWIIFFTAVSVAVNYSFSPLNAMNYFFSPLDTVKKNNPKRGIIFFHR